MDNHKDSKIDKLLDIIRICYFIFIVLSFELSAMNIAYGYIVLIVYAAYVIVNFVLIKKLMSEELKSKHKINVWIFTFCTIGFFVALSILQYQ